MVGEKERAVASAAPVVAGYELGELIARGATSEVWAAADLSAGRRVVVKVVHADLADVEAAAREAAVSARAASAHVVVVEACVDLPDGRVALVMPHVGGGSLDGLVRARGHLSPGEVVTVLAPVASAVGRLHELGVVHGDVSPGNVLLHLDGRPVLGDLGLSHVVGDVSPGVWGSDGYIAPEVVMGAEPTPAADVYGLGALGWLCLSGRAPGPPGLRPALADLSRAGAGGTGLLTVLEAACAPEPDDRPTAHELAWQLFGAADPLPLDLVKHDDEVTAVTYRLRAAATAPPEPPPRSGVAVLLQRLRRVRPDAAPWRRWRGHRLGAIGTWSGVAALLLVLGVLWAAALGGRDGVAEASDRPHPRPSTAPARTPAGTSTAPAADLRMDPHAPRGRPAALLGQLVEHRAQAWRDGAPAILAGADAPGSAAASRDAAAVADMARAGVRYSGLRHTVPEASVVSGSARTALVRARIDTTAYTVTGPSGDTTPRPAERADDVLVDLVWTDLGWRISDVRRAS